MFLRRVCLICMDNEAMTYECNSCEYNTRNSSHFRQHLESKSHTTKCASKNTCHKCLKQYSYKARLVKHLESCKAELVPRTRECANQVVNGDVQQAQAAETINNINVNIENLNVNGNVENVIPGLVSSIKDMLKNKDIDNITKRYLRAMMKSSSNVLDERFLKSITRKILDFVEDRKEEDERESDLEETLKRKNVTREEYFNRPLTLIQIDRILSEVFLINDLKDCVLFHENESYTNKPGKVLYKVSENLHDSRVMRFILEKTEAYSLGYIKLDGDEEYKIDVNLYIEKWHAAYLIMCRGIDAYNRRHMHQNGRALFANR